MFDSGQSACVFMVITCTAFVVFACLYFAVLCVWRCAKRCRSSDEGGPTQTGGTLHPSAWRDYTPYDSAFRPDWRDQNASGGEHTDW